MDIRTSDLRLISEALDTQIRLLVAIVNKSANDELRIMRFQELKENIDELILKD